MLSFSSMTGPPLPRPRQQARRHHGKQGPAGAHCHTRGQVSASWLHLGQTQGPLACRVEEVGNYSSFKKLAAGQICFLCCSGCFYTVSFASLLLLPPPVNPKAVTCPIRLSLRKESLKQDPSGVVMLCSEKHPLLQKCSVFGNRLPAEGHAHFSAAGTVPASTELPSIPVHFLEGLQGLPSRPRKPQ